jgi:hypothetical protein
MKRLIGRKPGMGKQADAASEISLDGHLLNIKKGNLFPA